MAGTLTFVLFAVGFYVIMRYGCGAHMVHGHGGHEHGRHGARDAAAPGPSTDPVCGMAVAPDQGYAKTYAGHQHRLCSLTCLDKFEGDPRRYVTSAGGVR